MTFMNAYQNFPELQTSRLMLRAVEITDARSYFDILSNESVMRYFGMFPLTHIEESLRLIDGFKTGFLEGRMIRWAIVDKETGELLGTCGFHSINKHSRRAEIGYELGEAYWHKGYCSEALGAIIAYGFNHLNFHRIEALVYPENIPSQKVLEHFSFKHEGLLKEHTYFRHVYQDLNLFALINQNHIRSKD